MLTMKTKLFLIQRQIDIVIIYIILKIISLTKNIVIEKMHILYLKFNHLIMNLFLV